MEIKRKIAESQKIILFLLAGMAFFTINANAGVGSSGGGVAIYCPNSSKAFLLDYYEAQTFYGMEIDLGSNGSNYKQKVEFALSRMMRVDPVRASLYKERFDSFANESRFLRQIQLTPTNDSFPAAIPQGCSIEQVAAQGIFDQPESPYYLVNEDLWDLLSETDKAGLILHEIIYRETRSRGAIKSTGARYLNSLISAKGFSTIPKEKYLHALQRNNLPFIAHKQSCQIHDESLKAKISFFGQFRHALLVTENGRNIYFRCKYRSWEGGGSGGSRTLCADNENMNLQIQRKYNTNRKGGSTRVRLTDKNREYHCL